MKNGYQGGLDLNKFISKIYAVERRDERDNISEWEKFGNKMLLWLGTKPENLIGILQTGLRIAPNVASGYSGGIFGEGINLNLENSLSYSLKLGIYFSDLFSKSYNYTNSYAYHDYNSYSAQSKSKKYMLLCEVALGKMKEFTSGNTTEIQGIPNKVHQSVKGVGMTGPDFAKSVYLANGCLVPAGRRMNYPRAKDQMSWNYLQHNEYVVYDETQVRIKYVLELRG